MEIGKLREDMETKRRLYERCETLPESKEAWDEYCKAKSAYEKVADADDTVVEYDKQANDFLRRFGLLFRCQRAVPNECPPFIETCVSGKHIHGDKFWIQIGRLRKTCDGRWCQPYWENRDPNTSVLGFPFWDSLANKQKREERGGSTISKPTPYDVLACISGDVHCPDTFEEFCADLCFDTDSRRAEAIFNRCHDFAEELRAFFTQEEIDALSEIQ